MSSGDPSPNTSSPATDAGKMPVFKNKIMYKQLLCDHFICNLTILYMHMLIVRFYICRCVGGVYGSIDNQRVFNRNFACIRRSASINDIGASKRSPSGKQRPSSAGKATLTISPSKVSMHAAQASKLC